MTKAEALEKLRRLKLVEAGEIEDRDSYDTEQTHVQADQVLLDLIDDPEIEAAWDAIPKWFS